MKSLLADISLPFAFVFLGLAGLFFYIAWQQESHAKALIGERQIAVARLTDKTTFTSSGMYKEGGFGEKGPTKYTLHYSFTLQDTGEAREGSSDVSIEVWDAVHIGNHYQVLFSRANPAITSLFDGQDFVDGAQLATRLTWIFGVLALLSAGLFVQLRQ